MFFYELLFLWCRFISQNLHFLLSVEALGGGGLCSVTIAFYFDFASLFVEVNFTLKKRLNVL